VAPVEELQPTEAFARLFARHERRIYSYIFSLLGDWQAAEDVFQDTCAVMWAKFAEFQPGTDFASWACRIGRYKALKYREQCARRLPFVGEEFLATVAAARESDDGSEDDWLAALSECTDKLTPRDRDIIVRRYSTDCTIKELAQRLGVPANTAYKAIRRIRKELLDCVQKTVARKARR
jgi:RNA polymerase sigma-70 factor, ECF subfamily